MNTSRKRKHEDVDITDSIENDQVNRPAKQWKATIPMVGDRRTGGNGFNQQRHGMQLNKPPQQWKVTLSIPGTRELDGRDTNNPEEQRNDACEDETVAASPQQEKKDTTVDRTADGDKNADQRQDDTSTGDENKKGTEAEPSTEANWITDEERKPNDVPSRVCHPSPEEQEQNQDREAVWIPTMIITEADKENFGPFMKFGIIILSPRVHSYTVSPLVHSYIVKLGDDIHQHYHVHLRIHEAFNGWWKCVASHLGERQCNKQRRPQAIRHEKKKLSFFKWPAILFKIHDLEDQDRLVGFGQETFQNLHPHHIHALVRTFCHQVITDTMLNNPKLNDLTLRVRFGSIAPPDENLNTDLNRFAYFDQIWRAAPSRMSRWPRMMGATLAILHWKCNLDARGVNFKIGRILRHFVGLILENPKHVQSFDPESFCAQSLALQIVSNPTWPRPVSVLLPEQGQDIAIFYRAWESFSDAYLSASERLLWEHGSEHTQRLPTSVLWWVVQLGVPGSTVPQNRRL